MEALPDRKPESGHFSPVAKYTPIKSPTASEAITIPTPRDTRGSRIKFFYLLSQSLPIDVQNSSSPGLVPFYTGQNFMDMFQFHLGQ